MVHSSVNRPLARSVGLPQTSSAFRPNWKVSPGRRSDGSTARQQTGGPGTTEIAGESGIGTWWPTAQTSASTRNWKSISTIV